MSSKQYNSIISGVDKVCPVCCGQYGCIQRVSAPSTVVPQHISTYCTCRSETVFFWAPMFKWGMVIAGLSDVNRPAEKLSINQSLVLATTGVIWSRYSLVIIPKNILMFSVNAFMSAIQFYQVYRAVDYQRSHPAN